MFKTIIKYATVALPLIGFSLHADARPPHKKLSYSYLDLSYVAAKTGDVEVTGPRIYMQGATAGRTKPFGAIFGFDAEVLEPDYNDLATYTKLGLSLGGYYELPLVVPTDVYGRYGVRWDTFDDGYDTTSLDPEVRGKEDGEAGSDIVLGVRSTPLGWLEVHASLVKSEKFGLSSDGTSFGVKFGSQDSYQVGFEVMSATDDTGSSTDTQVISVTLN